MMMTTLDWAGSATTVTAIPVASRRAEPGWTVRCKYEILRLLGRGGMGLVWLVRHRTLGRQAALKQISPVRLAQREVLERFRREMSFLSLFSCHRHGVVVYDACADGDEPYIEMEYVEGRSLDQVLIPGVPMATVWVERVLGQLASVLRYGHLRGVVHGDLKPSNLMLSADPSGPPRLRVLDFGLATALGCPDPISAPFSGTPAYASPEQVRGEPLDARADLYAVGVLLYEFLTGHRPFSGPLPRLLAAVEREEPPQFCQANPQCQAPAAVENLVRSCLAKDPADRPASAEDLCDRFHFAARRE